jgi:Arc/MetJ-type ribon-helix-helix transcriptional regulator
MSKAQARDRGRDAETNRVTVRLPESLDEDYEAMVEEGDLYHSKSEAIRTALRAHRDLLSTEDDDGGE